MTASELETFKDALIKADLYMPATETEKASHSDATLLSVLPSAHHGLLPTPI